MEWKIGEIKQVNGEWYQCVEQPEKYDKTVCALCAFQDNGDCELDRCSGTSMSDKKFVIFKKLEKVGGTYAHNSIIVQKYKIKTIPVIMPNEPYMYFNAINNTIEIEIKQTKEDMEEKGQCCDNRFEIIAKAKEALLNETNIARDEQEMSVIDNILFRCWQMGWLDKYEAVRLLANDDTKYSNSENIGNNLKPFNLEAAKAGKPICTRDGRKARIICFDMNIESYPILALINNGLFETAVNYNKEGKSVYCVENLKNDLMMLPEKKEGYVNLYHNCNDRYAAYLGNNVIYKDKEFAEEMGRGDINYIKTVKVQWEE